MATNRPKHLILILARELASNLATPTLITDERGVLVFYNEAASKLVERPFAEVGELPLEEWLTQFAPRTIGDEEPLSLEQQPTGIALHERRAAHERYEVTSADGIDRAISVTSFPLFAHAGELVGSMTIFWRE